MLTAGSRIFALAPAGDGEYRFTGWSEQRTLQPSDRRVLLRARRGHAVRERHIGHNEPVAT